MKDQRRLIAALTAADAAGFTSSEAGYLKGCSRVRPAMAALRCGRALLAGRIRSGAPAATTSSSWRGKPRGHKQQACADESLGGAAQELREAAHSADMYRPDSDAACAGGIRVLSLCSLPSCGPVLGPDAGV